MSVKIDDIITAIQNNRVRITDHADEEAQADALRFAEIYFSVQHGEIIEDYPTDKPFPSCLIVGETFAGELVHSVWAYNPANQWAVLITVYRPDPQRWIEGRNRRPKP
jgi:hypothetical protein